MKNKFEIHGDIVTIYINSKYGEIKTIIDVSDFELVNGYKNSWCINYKIRRCYKVQRFKAKEDISIKK